MYYLFRDDLAAALEAVIDCCKKYGKLPKLHDILCRLIEKGDTELLQKGWLLHLHCNFLCEC